MQQKITDLNYENEELKVQLSLAPIKEEGTNDKILCT